MLRRMDLGTVMVVWAHPDDESYLSAGLMSHQSANGHRVVCVTATRGEEGSWDHDRWPPTQMGEMREAELRAALAELGDIELIFLDYHDGDCHDVTPAEGADKVGALIRDIRPDSVLTFGPEGQTLHPDHLAVHRWTTDAFEREARAGSKLYYSTETPEWVERFVPLLNSAFEVFPPGSPGVTERAALGIDFHLSDELLRRKRAALGAHVSQFGPMLDAVGEEVLRRALENETYKLARTR